MRAKLYAASRERDDACEQANEWFHQVEELNNKCLAAQVCPSCSTFTI